MEAQYLVNESIQKVDAQTWLVGGRLLISRSSTATAGYLWTDGHGLFYGASEVTGTAPASQPFPSKSSGPFPLVYDADGGAGGASAVWEIGNAFLKVRTSGPPGTTREYVTLAALKTMSVSFAFPDVLYHGEWAGRIYLIVSKLPGQTLTDAWPTIDEATKCRYVDRVVSICNELAKHQADYIGGIDKNQLNDSHLTKARGVKDYRHESLLKNCTEIGMDCSGSFVFYHCDMGPGNLIIDPNGSLGIIDWEMAGFVPREWIRTRFCVSGGLDLPGTGDERMDWRGRVETKLSDEGYPELAEEWMAWWRGE